MTCSLHFRGGATSATLIVRQSPRAKAMRLRVDERTGAVTLTVPRRMSRRAALEWAAGKRAWIEAALSRVPEPVAIVPGGMLPLYAVPHRLDWVEGGSRLPSLGQGRILIGGPLDSLEARLLRWLKRHALDLLRRETLEFAQKASVGVERVGVGDPLSRWGSCSASGAIRYSWRLILAPDWVRRATVAHEVAHRVHMNHGPQFHALAAALLGADPVPARQWLRRHGSELHRIGRIL